MERMAASQMERLEAYFSAREKNGGITNDEIRKYVKREFGITLTKTYIPDLRTRLKKGKAKTPMGRAAKMGTPEEAKPIRLSDFIPRDGVWNPPFCIYNKDQEMTLELFRSTKVHFIENHIPDIPDE